MKGVPMKLLRAYCEGATLILLSCGFYCLAASLENVKPKPLKLLVLIIASDSRPVYIELQQAWRSYMHRDPEHIQAYFIKANPLLKEDYLIDGDIIWCKTEEIERPGIINKTILSLEAMMPFMDQIDYVLRTNLSSFYIFDRLLKILEASPRTKFCYGSFFYWYQYQLPSGCGYVFSTDLARQMCEQKHRLMNDPNMPDDAISGLFFIESGASYVIHERFCFWDLDSWNCYKDAIPEAIFQIRVKNYYDTKRESEDIIIYKQLVDKYYPS
jgi:hypothetical protein